MIICMCRSRQPLTDSVLNTSVQTSSSPAHRLMARLGLVARLYLELFTKFWDCILNDFSVDTQFGNFRFCLSDPIVGCNRTYFVKALVDSVSLPANITKVSFFARHSRRIWR